MRAEYHEKSSWKIKDYDFIAAKDIALALPIEYEKYDSVQTAKNLPPSTFIVAAHFNDMNGKQKTKEVLRVRVAIYNKDIGQLLRDDSFETNIMRGLNKKGVLSDSVWSIRMWGVAFPKA